jgi:hypothetical protein
MSPSKKIPYRNKKVVKKAPLDPIGLRVARPTHEGGVVLWPDMEAGPTRNRYEPFVLMDGSDGF